ncbi:MAG: hypothetical protein NZ700_10225 [Gemmataceae bacterium]|nr:hypothetical protein [Gemmataceae bacterium]MDW8265505.1 hypothetical protein [Gemmataceae bacterium]
MVSHKGNWGAVMAAWGLACWLSGPVGGQQPSPNPPANQFFRVNTANNVTQAAREGAISAQAFAAAAAYGQGFNPFNVTAQMSSSMPSYGYGGGYFGWGNFSMDPYGFGGYLGGGASVISAQGQFLINNQQARLIDQAVQRAKLENRRRVFDQWLYERANTPTYEDERERTQALERRRARNDPPISEILSSKSLNDLLASIQQMHARRIEGQDVPLDEELMRHVNVTAARNGSNFGLLKNEARLNWPLALRDESMADVRIDIDSLLQEAYRQAKGGRVDPGVLRGLSEALRKMNDLLRKNVRELSPSAYMEAKRFLGDLESAYKVLQQPDVGNFFNGRYSAQGRTVKELVQYMTKNGLIFAPAVPGDEAAYVALQRAMAEYDISGQALVSDR